MIYVLGMDQFNSGFNPKEAKIRYLDADYVVTSPGTFVRCGFTGKPIQIDDLKYWNVDKQEAYRDANAAYKAYCRDNGIDPDQR